MLTSWKKIRFVRYWVIINTDFLMIHSHSCHSLEVLQKVSAWNEWAWIMVSPKKYWRGYRTWIFPFRNFTWQWKHQSFEQRRSSLHGFSKKKCPKIDAVPSFPWAMSPRLSSPFPPNRMAGLHLDNYCRDLPMNGHKVWSKWLICHILQFITGDISP